MVEAERSITAAQPSNHALRSRWGGWTLWIWAFGNCPFFVQAGTSLCLFVTPTPAKLIITLQSLMKGRQSYDRAAGSQLEH